MVETVAKLEKKVETHQKLLEYLLDPSNQTASGTLPRLPLDLLSALQQASPSPPSSSCSSSSSTSTCTTATSITTLTTCLASSASSASSNSQAGCGPQIIVKPDFETLFVEMLEAFKGFKQEDKPPLLRKIVHNRTMREIELLTEFVDLLNAEGLNRATLEEVGTELFTPTSFPDSNNSSPSLSSSSSSPSSTSSSSSSSSSMGCGASSSGSPSGLSLNNSAFHFPGVVYSHTSSSPAVEAPLQFWNNDFPF